MVSWVLIELFGLLIMMVFIIEFCYEGEVHFNIVFFDVQPFSIEAYIYLAYQSLLMLWMTSIWVIYTLVILELLLRVSFYFRVIADQIRELRGNESSLESKEMKKLCSLVDDFELLKW